MTLAIYLKIFLFILFFNLFIHLINCGECIFEYIPKHENIILKNINVINEKNIKTYKFNYKNITECSGILVCYQSQLSANLPFTSSSKPNKRFELTRKQNSQLCLKNWENEEEKLKIDKFKDVEWHGFIIFQQGTCLKIQADIFSKNILLYNIQASDLLNFLFGNNNEIKSKIIEASEIDKNLISESKNLLNEYAGILALKMDIMIFKEIKTKRQLFWTYINRCPIKNEETKIFKMSVISDMDKDSKVNNNTWQSYFIRGILYFSPPDTNVTWTETIIFLTSTATKKGRAMELSDLAYFNGNLLTIDDKNGNIYKINNFTNFTNLEPWVSLTDGNKKHFKGEWMTVKDKYLYVGSTGSEFVNKDGTVRDKNRMFIKKINSKGEIQHIDWFNNYDKLRNAANCSFPGFLVKRIGNSSVDTAKGFSAFQFLPNKKDEFIVAVKSEEINGKSEASYLSVFNIFDGKFLIEEKKFNKEKFEGLIIN